MACEKEHRLAFTDKAWDIVGRMSLEEKVYPHGSGV
jgi:hypothetical protein